MTKLWATFLVAALVGSGVGVVVGHMEEEDEHSWGCLWGWFCPHPSHADGDNPPPKPVPPPPPPPPPDPPFPLEICHEPTGYGPEDAY